MTICSLVINYNDGLNQDDHHDFVGNYATDDMTSYYIELCWRVEQKRKGIPLTTSKIW